MGNLLELRWHKDSRGYSLVRDGGHTYVVPRGGELKEYTCKADDLRILRDLLEMAKAPEGVLEFVNRWGLLDASTPVDDLLREVAWYVDNRGVLAGVLRGDGLPHKGSAELASVKLIRGPTGQLSLRADTLGDFLWAQTFQCRQGAVFQCPICKKFVLAKSTGRPRTSSCSSACRQKAHRRRDRRTGIRGGQDRGIKLDLAAWARGDCEYLFTEVRLAIAERWGGKVVTKRSEALQFLIDDAVIEADEARQDL